MQTRLSIIIIVFSQVEEEKIEEAAANYNVTDCCVEANINSVCLPLCSYDANMNDVKRLAVCGSGMNGLALPRPSSFEL